MARPPARRPLGGTVFVACMFIGGGLGMAFGRPEVGGAIGMGVGFLLMSLVRVRTEPMEVSLPAGASGHFILLLGIAFVLTGLVLLYYPDFLRRYGIGILPVLFGIGLAIYGLRVMKKQ